MQVHIMACDMDVSEVIKKGSYVPTIVRDDIVVDKPIVDLTDLDKKKLQYNWKARNVIISILLEDEYYLVSTCKTAQRMWDVLQVTH